MKKIKIGKNEKELLLEIAEQASDATIGFLLSGTSVKRMYEVIRHRQDTRERKKVTDKVHARQLADLKRRRKLMLERLERKNLITITSSDSDAQVILSKKGAMYAEQEKLLNKVKNQKNKKWDKKWTLVMFDVPNNETHKRVLIKNILLQIGFKQVQMSNYVFPYDVPELRLFLQNNASLGEYCHIFRGVYDGDDSKLKKMFKL